LRDPPWSGQSSGATGTIRYLYAGDDLAVEYNGSGNVLRRYVHDRSAEDLWRNYWTYV
jgi:hypothetical protein